MVDFQADGGGQGARPVVAVEAVGQEQERGAEALAAGGEGVGYGGVEALGLCGVVDGGERRFDGVVELCGIGHGVCGI